MSRRIPAIVSDIDGVIVRGGVMIRGSKTVLDNLLNKQFYFSKEKQNKFKFPFVCLTNGGGKLEMDKANELNQIINDPIINLTKENIILNYTPLRDVILKDWTSKPVLILGHGRILDISSDCGFTLYVTIFEYAAYMRGHFLTFREREEKSSTIETLMERYNINNKIVRFKMNEAQVDEVMNSIQGIFIFHDPVYWEDALYVAINHLCKDKQLPLFIVNNDVTYSDTFKYPRLAFGAFNYILKDQYKKLNKKDLIINMYGKPTKMTSDFTVNYLNKLYNNEIGNIYMFGDNPKSDIRGANLAGWTSILVRTGIFQEEGNDHEDPAKYVVKDMEEAYNLVCKLENVSCL